MYQTGLQKSRFLHESMTTTAIKKTFYITLIEFLIFDKFFILSNYKLVIMKRSHIGLQRVFQHDPSKFFDVNYVTYGFDTRKCFFGMKIFFCKALLKHLCICHITRGFTTCDMTYMHLCFCKSFAKKIPIPKNQSYEIKLPPQTTCRFKIL